jgi:hypothetical protein
MTFLVICAIIALNVLIGTFVFFITAKLRFIMESTLTPESLADNELFLYCLLVWPMIVCIDICLIITHLVVSINFNKFLLYVIKKYITKER